MTTLLNSEYFSRHVRKRMAELGLTQAAIRERGGPSDTTLRKILEGAPVGMTIATLSKLDHSLGWTKGSAARTLAGGDPVPKEGESVVDDPVRGGDVRKLLDERGWSTRQDSLYDVITAYGELDPETSPLVRIRKMLNVLQSSIDVAQSVAIQSETETLRLDLINALSGPVAAISFIRQDLADLTKEFDPNAERTAPATDSPAKTPGASGAPSHKEADAGDRQHHDNVHPLNPTDQGEDLDDLPPALDDEDVAARETPPGYKKGQPTEE
jgi:hypothetical protein